MLKRFTAILVILMIMASMGTVFAAPTMSDSKKTMNDLIKEEPMITNEDEIKAALNDQIILMMYIRAIEQILMKMTPAQLKTAVQIISPIANNQNQAKKQELQQRVQNLQQTGNDKRAIAAVVGLILVFLPGLIEDQNNSTLFGMMSIMTTDQLKSMIKDNNNVMQTMIFTRVE